MLIDIGACIASFMLGALVATLVAIECVSLHTRDSMQREMVQHGQAYWTNSPHGYPVFKMKEVKP